MPEDIATKIGGFKAQICTDPSQEVTIDNAIDRAMGFKKVDGQYAAKAENDLVAIMSDLVTAWGWNQNMIDQNRGVKRSRNGEDEDKKVESKEGTGEKGDEE